MSRWLARAALEHPSATALVEGDRRLDYRELALASGARAAWLNRIGIGAGDRVVLPVTTTMDTAIWIHALLWLGAPLIPVSPHLHRHTIEAIWRHLAPSALVAVDSTWSAAARDRDEALCDGILVDAAQPIEVDQRSTPSPFDDPAGTATILLTSGSSAAPKAVPLRFGQHAASAEAVARRIGLQPSDRWLLALPLNHIGGLAILLRSVIFASSVVMQPRFDAREFADRIGQQPITLASLVPGMLEDLARTGRRCRSTALRAILVGGARTSAALLSRARGMGWPVLPTWGMTEAASQLATPAIAAAASLEEDSERPPPLPPLDDVEIRAAPDGRLVVRGPMLFDGYLGAGDGPDADGWFTTGDRGIVDPDGSVRVLGRADDVVISGGLNVHLDAVAGQLLDCPLISEAATVAVDDQRWGQRVAAAVVAAQATDDPGRLVESLDRWARERLAPEERPVRWAIVDRIPRSSTGKPIRPAVTTLFE